MQKKTPLGYDRPCFLIILLFPNKPVRESPGISHFSLFILLFLFQLLCRPVLIITALSIIPYNLRINSPKPLGRMKTGQLLPIQNTFFEFDFFFF